MTPQDLEAILARHQPTMVERTINGTYYDSFVACSACEDTWPCDASKLAALLTPEALATAFLRGDLAAALLEGAK